MGASIDQRRLAFKDLQAGGEDLAQVVRKLTDGKFFSPDHSAGLPSVGGAYLLAVFLAKPFQFSASSIPVATMPAGWYVYAGSAQGPGGLRARVGRHLRKGKKPRWHIERLTETATEMFAGLLISRRECDLIAQILKSTRFQVPIPGFGSSDFRVCSSHLAAFRP